MIDKALGLNNPDPVETYSNSPHLYAELGIPAEATGTVGAARKSPVKRRDSESRGQSDGQKPARSRSDTRRRTRGGQAVTGHTAGTAPASTNGEAAAQAPTAAASTSGATNRRRRRRRKPTESTAASAPSN